MIAKLDNLGPFQLFFTLSCADMRWDENFGSILQDNNWERLSCGDKRWGTDFKSILKEKGWDIEYTLKKDNEDNWDNIVEARKSKEESYKPIKQFIKEDVEESIHELSRENVLKATKYYQQ